MAAFRQAFGVCNFTLLSEYYERDLKSASDHGDARLHLDVVGYPLRPEGKRRWMVYFTTVLRSASSLLLCVLWKILSGIGLPSSFLLREKDLSAFPSADLVVDLSGDSFTDDRMAGFSLFNCMRIFLAILLRKPFVIYSQSIGPFSWYSRPIVRLCLKRARAIALREEVSLGHLRSLGLTDLPVFIRADCAFALESVTKARVKEILFAEGVDLNNTGQLIGVSPSYDMEISSEKYVRLIAKLVDWMVEAIDAQVLLVPHVFTRGWINAGDDRRTARHVFSALKDQSKVKVINREYRPSELKGVIGSCDLFIGCRMHANIAALSMGIPTIALGYGHKFHGIMASFGLERFVFEYRQATFEQLATAVNELWSQREDIRRSLQTQSTRARESALEAAVIVRALLNR
jgi:colanic acid/amylovoran biosynthesis protein